MGHRKVKFRHADPLASMPWDEFERLMARHYAARGYRVEHSGTGAQTGRRRFDGGIDLKLFRDGEYIVVQCKRETVLQVTHNVVHELIGVMHTQHASRAIVVNTGEFSAAAMVAAAAFPQIELIDGVELRRMLAETGDLPTAHWTDDILASLADTRRRRKRPSRNTGRSRSATLMIWLAKGILAIGMPAVIAFVVIPFIVKTATAPLIQPLAGGDQPAHPASSAPAVFTKPSKKETEEWDKKNAESMRILEKTTPSLE